MTSTVSIAAPLVGSSPTSGRALRNRTCLLVLTVAALSIGAALGSGSKAIEPDLARLFRFMAMLKGAFAAIALFASFWRLGRAATPWRETVYVAAPGLMAGGALCLWQLHGAGLAAVGLHLGMFALLAAALTDRSFVPTLRRRSA